jgi:GT2 family glycosyltransferase
MNNRIGVGIVTCNREDFFFKCLDSIPKDKVDTLITVNDGKEYSKPPGRGTYLQHKKNKCVGISKNEAIRHLLEDGCEHIFIIEDDIIIKDDNVFEKYINTAEASGLWHLMYGYHGPANKINGKPAPRVVVDYGDEKVALNRHCVGAFCYYYKGVINNVGLMDEKFHNAWEHVEHSYRIVNAGLLPAYWWWPDVGNSCDYLDELACSEESSTIRWEDPKTKTPKPDWQKNIQEGMEYFVSKHKYAPVTVPDSQQDSVLQSLGTIKTAYSRKVLTV